jgi:hypothetical protein
MAPEDSSRSPDGIDAILAGRSETASAVYRHALWLLELQRRLRALLAPPLNDHVTVANCRKGALIIHADSAAWAARLRFRIPDILAGFKETPPDAAIQSVRIKVRPPDSTQPPPPAQLTISDDTARLLQSVAESISDPDLRASLLRLHRHRRGNSG